MPGSEEYRAEAENRRARSVSEIEADITATTERLSASVDELAARMSPAQIAKRSARQARAVVTTPGGAPRAEVVGALIGALAGAAVLVWWSRRR